MHEDVGIVETNLFSIQCIMAQLPLKITKMSRIKFCHFVSIHINDGCRIKHEFLKKMFKTM